MRIIRVNETLLTSYVLKLRSFEGAAPLQVGKCEFKRMKSIKWASGKLKQSNARNDRQVDTFRRLVFLLSNQFSDVSNGISKLEQTTSKRSCSTE
jgi:hypothetical protein